MIPLEQNQRIQISINFVPNEAGIQLELQQELITPSILEGVPARSRPLNVAELLHCLREVEEQMTTMMFNDNVDMHQRIHEQMVNPCPANPN